MLCPRRLAGDVLFIHLKQQLCSAFPGEQLPGQGVIHCLRLAVTASKSGAKRGWRGEACCRRAGGDVHRSHRCCTPGMLREGSWGCLCSELQGFGCLVLVTNTALRGGAKCLIAVGFPQPCASQGRKGEDERL